MTLMTLSCALTNFDPLPKYLSENNMSPTVLFGFVLADKK